MKPGMPFGWWERFKCWLVCCYLRDTYNMSHCQWGVRRKRVMGALLDGVRATFTEDNMSTALHFIVDEMLKNSEDNQRSVEEYGECGYTLTIGERPELAVRREPEPEYAPGF